MHSRVQRLHVVGTDAARLQTAVKRRSDGVQQMVTRLRTQVQCDHRRAHRAIAQVHGRQYMLISLSLLVASASPIKLRFNWSEP